MQSFAPGIHHLTLEHQERTRHYKLYMPGSIKAPYPVVLAFHGAGALARIMLLHSRWLARAESEGFIVVAPEGTAPKPDEKPSFRFNPQLWNLGGTMTSTATRNADDVGFVRTILDHLPERVEIDPKRVYATGFSNGAGLCFRLGVELNERLAAISPVAALPYFMAGPPPRPIPTYFLIGSKDPLVPWEGGTIITPWNQSPTVRPPVLEQLERWTTLNGLTISQQVIESTAELEEVILAHNDQTEVRYTKLLGLGHHWPGGRDVGVPEEILGVRIKTIDATERIWEFFKRYSL